MPDESMPALLAQRYLVGALKVRKGEKVLIESWNHTLPYASACVVEARRLGAHPMLVLEDESAWWKSLDTLPTPARWTQVGDHEWAANAGSDAYVFFPGPADRPRMAALPDPIRRSLVAYNAEWYQRASKSKLRMVRSMLGYASDSQAARWGVNGAAWRSQLIQATIQPDLKTLAADARRAAAKLAKGKLLRVTAPTGTDFTLKLRGRLPVVDDGVVDAADLRLGQNVAVSPPGTIIVAVDERSAEGVAIANRPSFLPTGRAEAGQWEMHQGHVTNFWYSEGQEGFESAYEKAPKGRDIVSIFSLGLNPSLAAGTPQVEDQEAGAVSLAIGGNQLYGGTNRCPYLSWIVLGEATVAVDGKPLCDRGKIL
jgi:leucyl aminopeptidase (aminopeptidase T)